MPAFPLHPPVNYPLALCYNRGVELSEELTARLRALADRYETAGFMDGDPSMALTRYKNQPDIEAAAFISAMLAFGRREQFLKKTAFIFSLADAAGGMAHWLKSGAYRTDFVPAPLTDAPETAASPALLYERKFYRFYSYRDMRDLFDALAEILQQSPTMSEYFERQYRQALRDAACDSLPLAPLISRAFASCAVVPHGKDSANKRVNMFLRWMVRRNSPVDLGLWTWYRPADLIMPLDTHVLRIAAQFGLIPECRSGNFKTALTLTAALKAVWPDDPCRGDFALFGLGVDAAAH